MLEFTHFGVYDLGFCSGLPSGCQTSKEPHKGHYCKHSSFVEVQVSLASRIGDTDPENQ